MAFYGQFPPQGLLPQQQRRPNSLFGAPPQPPAQNFHDDDVEIVEEDSNEGGGEDFNVMQGHYGNTKNFGGEGGGRPSQFQLLSKEIAFLKQENQSIKNALMEFHNDRDKLRAGVRKLKMENNRFKAKLKRITEAVSKKRQEGGDIAMEADATKDDAVEDSLADDVDFDDIGEFLLIGGPSDPLSVQYRSPIRDADGHEFKSLEHYLWYKMAETFVDQDAMNQILAADTSSLAEEIAKNIVNFDQKTWDAVKMRHWEEGQRLKLDQHRWIKCLLIKTGKHYLAVASQDKVFGTGWRKQREEAAQPHMWDGENCGGKFLMKLRKEYAANHAWTTPTEEQEASKAFYENKRNVWKRRRDGEFFGGSSRRRGGGPKMSSRNASNTLNKALEMARTVDMRRVQQAPTYVGMTTNQPNMGINFTDFQNLGRPAGHGGGNGGKRGGGVGGYDKRFRFE